MAKERKKYVKVIFVDKQVKASKKQRYTYRMPKFDVNIFDMLVVKVGNGNYSIAQCAGFADTINFDKSKLRNIKVNITESEKLQCGNS